MKITGMFPKHGDKTTLQRQITKGEAMLCRLIVNSNLSPSSADKLVPVVVTIKMFPDSNIARGMQCGRSKATAVIKGMSAMAMTIPARRMKNVLFLYFYGVGVPMAATKIWSKCARIWFGTLENTTSKILG
eukprot:TRINITY_DN26422_c0_g1_i7.p1 TRINITY_DN26422_c0_g1~~TRINITY_DN26422_c0_g1_i7.p1  ORF type:complete len:131 (-),score=15.77 TRINITY_DN26422_c0_g1_i7:90-482(-)